jgi:DegV family protein with EDD domain
MTGNLVKLVTDSVSDLPPEVASELDITVIPLIVNFGGNSYKDRVELTAEEFYNRLANCTELPKTSAPSPGFFANIFDQLATKCNEIFCVFLSSKFSSTYESAVEGMQLMKNKARVEIVDSKLALMGQGMVVIEAAKKAMAGAKLNDLADMVSRSIPKVHTRVTLDTLKYLEMGGRIGKVQALLGSLLKMNPILGIKDGEAFPFTRVRSRKKANEWLYQFATKFSNVKGIAVEYGSNLAEARELARRIASAMPKVPVHISNVSPVIGTHTGPTVLSVSVLEE